MMIISFVLVGILFPDTAFAASDEIEKALMKLQETINIGFGLVHAAFWPILLMIGSLMDNDLIFGPGIGDRLREIWVVMRNIVNISFVFLLLVIAFYNVTGLGGEGNFALKTVLPKFVIALIAVNFSFLACKVILDAANVVSMAVYDITGSIEDYDADTIKDQMEYMICTNPTDITGTGSDTTVVEDAGEVGAESEGSTDATGGWDYENASPITKAFCCSSNKDESYECTTTENETVSIPKAESEEDREIFPVFNDAGKSFFQQVDQNNIGIIMAINLGSLNHLTEMTNSETGASIKDLSINTLFSILMYIVFGFAYVALFIVLLARLVVLWFVIAMSPLIALTMVVPQINQYASELNLAEKFVQHLLAPIIIGLSMSIGYLLTDKIKNTGAGGIDIGGVGSSSFNELTSGGSSGTFLAPNVSDLQQLMVVCIAVAVVWMGVFGAADKTIASSVTNPIKEFGTKAAKFIAKLPTYAPIVPIMTREGEEVKPYSFSEITHVMKDITNIPEQWSQKRARSLSAELGITSITSEAFNKLSTDYKNAATKADKKAVVTSMLGSIHNDSDYDAFRELLSEEHGIEAPKSWHRFDEWYASEGHKKFNTAFNTDEFTGTEYTDRTGEKKKDDAGADRQQQIQQFNTFYEQSSEGNTKEERVQAAAAKMESQGQVAPGTDTDALVALLSEVSNGDGTAIDSSKTSRLKFDTEGRLVVSDEGSDDGTPDPPPSSD